jgi:glycogen debranching enzyme
MGLSNGRVGRRTGELVLRAIVGIAVLAGCGPEPEMRPDASTDAGADAGPHPEDDAGAFDAGGTDAGPHADAGPPGCLAPVITGSAATDRLEDALGVATVTIEDRDACRRAYVLASTAPRRDNLPASPRRIVEQEGEPSIRTGHDLFDALYALALAEARENAVDAIHDWAFDEGRPIDCGTGCYETGRLWNYVWTRDTAYSVALGLSAIDPERARNSLEFKTSERRGGGGLEIVQDTGTGGSWPVSTDRVSWAIGAEALLPWLEERSRAEFRDRALRALRHTIERDRRTVYDAATGLYRGEQSFLDWREQSYPEWTAQDVAHIAASEALSTNVVHLRALEVAADLAEESGDRASASRWRGWAAELRSAIRMRLWDEDAGLFSTYLTTGLDRSPTRRWDLLGESLAILAGVADETQALRILSAYPHVGPGAAPVIFPQQQWTRIYHNRAEWPFVTAFWLMAARRAGHDAAGDRALLALVRGAALNLSNMENLETVRGAPWVDDGPYSGPVVNSHRQLWSVAGYIGMVHHVVFGIEASREGLRVRPFITRRIRRELFGNADSIVLRNLRFGGTALDVVVHLPPASEGGGVLPIVATRLNGTDVGGRAIRAGELGARARIDVVLGGTAGPARTITEIRDLSEWRALYGPRTPRITALTLEGTRVRVTYDTGGEPAEDVVVAVYRDGTRVADDLPGAGASYLDPLTDALTTTHCWAVESCFASTRTCSQHSPPRCFWGPANERVTVIDATRFAATGGTGVTEYGRFHYQAWGDPGHRLVASGFVAPASGRYLLQTLYGNGGPIDTGITAAFKRVLVEDEATGEVVARGAIVMPHLGRWDRWGESTFAEVRLDAGRRYRFVITGDDDTVNMSAFQHFATYTAGAGGRDGPFARVNIAELRILQLGP